MFPGEHVDDVHLPRVPVIGREDVPHGLPERLAEERIAHKDDARVVRHCPVDDTGSGALDHPSTLPVAKLLNIAPSHCSQFTVNLDAHDSRVRPHPRDQ